METIMLYSSIALNIAFLATIIVLAVRSKKKAKRLSVLYENLRAELDVPSENFSVRVSSSQSMLQMIDDMIGVEIVAKRKFEIFLNEKNKNLDMDRVIEEVSQKVFDYINPNIFVREDLVFTEEYLMNYIIHKTTIAYINYVKNSGVADQF